MKSICVLILLFAGVLSGGCRSVQPAMQPDVTGQQITYEVYGMDCPGCHGGVEKNLMKVPGVVAASANWKQKTVTVTVAPDQQVDDAAIEKAVKDSNFTLGENSN